MADEWIHMYNQQLPFHLSTHDQHNNNPGSVSDSTVGTAAATPSHSSGLTPDGGRVVKPVRKRSRASRRTPTTLLNTDAANFRAMVQQFTGGPSNNNTTNFAAFGFPGNSTNSVYDPTVAAYHLAAPPQPPPMYQFQNQHAPPLQQQQPPFMFSLGNSAGREAFFQQGGGLRSDYNNNNNNNVDYMGLLHGSSPAAKNPRPA